MAENEAEMDELLRYAQKGDRAAFSRWLSGHYDYLYRLSYRLLGNVMDAEDLTHDVCIRLGSVLGQYDGRGSVKGWLSRIVLNAGRDFMRRQQRRRTVDIDAVAEPEGQANVTDEVYSRQVLAVVAELPDDLRVPLLLTAEGLTYAEIAVALECPDGTVAWRISCARKELTKRLEGRPHVARRG